MAKTIKVIIVDDEQKAITLLGELLKEFEEINVVASAENVDQAVEAILEFNPEIVFLDIQMPGKNGFELLHEIHDFDIQPTIVFVTAFDEYAIDAIRYSAFDYLLKPVNPVELKKAISRYQHAKKEELSEVKRNLDTFIKNISVSKLRFNTRTGAIFINPEEIIYVQADGNYSNIHLVNDKVELVTAYLSTVEEKLPEIGFFRISRSVVINLKYLKRIDRKKRECILEYENNNYLLQAPLKNIKKLEQLNS